MTNGKELNYGKGTLRNISILLLIFGVGFLCIGITYLVINVFQLHQLLWLILVIPLLSVGLPLTVFSCQMITISHGFNSNTKKYNDKTKIGLTDHLICSNCKETLKESDAFCPNCGEKMTKKIICPRCFNLNDEKNKFCHCCGFRIKNDELKS